MGPGLSFQGSSAVLQKHMGFAVADYHRHKMCSKLSICLIAFLNQKSICPPNTDYSPDLAVHTDSWLWLHGGY